jgi:hypothetical protein
MDAAAARTAEVVGIAAVRERLARWTDPAASTSRGEVALWCALTAIALTLRILTVVQRSGTATLRGMVDTPIYVTLAQRLPQENWLPSEGLYMSPLYPYLLALLPAGLSAGVALVLLVQAAGGAAAGVALACVARRFGGALAGVASLVLAAFAAPLALYDASLLADAPAFACFAAAMALWMLQPDKARAQLAAGMLAALAYLFRANLLPAILGWAAWRLWCERRGALRALLLLLAPLAIAMLGLASINQRAEGHFTPRSFNAGQNLYIGNNPQADGGYTLLNEIHPADMMGRGAAERVAQRPLDAAEVERFWRDQALRFLREHPHAALSLAARKLLLCLHAYEFPQMEALALVRQESAALRFCFVGFALLLPLAVTGAFAAHAARRRELMPLWIALLGSVVICVVFFVNGRLRLPLWAPLLPLAGLGVAALVRAGLERRRRAWIVLAAGVLLTAAIARYPTHAAYRHSLSAARYAVLEALAGNRAAAGVWMQRETEYEREPGSWSESPDLESTFSQHAQTRWLLAMERAAAWYVMGDPQRAYADMLGAADALPQSRRAQEGLVEIADTLLRQGLGDASVFAAQQRAQNRLERL